MDPAGTARMGAQHAGEVFAWHCPGRSRIWRFGLRRPSRNSVLLYDKCSKITPVPGGVGPVTIAMLVKHSV